MSNPSENGVSNAKLDTNCSLKDIQYWADMTIMYGIDSSGQPMEEVDHTDDSDFRCYVCMNCDNDFDSFNKVKEHLNA